MAEVGALRISLGLDSVDFTQGMKQINTRLNALNSEFKAITSGAGRFDNSLESLNRKSDVLTRTFTAHQRKVEELKRKYEESKAAKGEDAEETLRAATAYNRAVAAMNTVEHQLNEINDEIEEQTNRWKRLGRSMNDVGSSMEETGTKLRDVGSNLTTSITMPLLGFAAAAGKIADDFDATTGRIQARLGVTAERAEELGDVAKAVWKDAFGEDLREVGDAITTVNNNLQGLSDKELKNAAEAAYLLKDAFDAELNESTRAAGQLMKDFGVNSEKSFDLLTWGFQNGLDYTGEFLDTIREYSPQFAEMGYNAEQMLNTLKVG